MWASVGSSPLRAAEFAYSGIESVPLELGANQKEGAGWSDGSLSHQANRWERR